ncbi:hypothetical protein GCM10010170_088840 [Dactylosporangium salmoneum]|uniref:Uncharacterized protein n=1 Tax=Dactylosporangium salmoneum TaxID=53361 RepID=A0ABP5UI48_9ACTN
MTECARVILCESESPGGLTGVGAAAGRGRHGGAGTAPDPDGDDGEGARFPAAEQVRGFEVERLTRAAGPSTVAIGGGTARANRAVVVNRASAGYRAGGHRAAACEVAA